MVYQGLRRRHYIPVAELAIHLSVHIIRRQGNGFAAIGTGRGDEFHLPHQQGVPRRSQIQRVEHRITADVIGVGTAHVYRQGEAGP